MFKHIALLSMTANPFIGKLMPFYYPLLPTHVGKGKAIHKVEVCDVPLACYTSKNDSIIVHSDICPHQGASLSKGWITSDGNIQCPYHGFEFCEGMFCKIPNPQMGTKAFRSRTKLDVYQTTTAGGNIYFHPFMKGDIDPPFLPPEEYDVNFRSVQGTRILDQDYMMVCENLLDMLHISYVHSFGSTLTPLPFTITARNLTRTSCRTEFLYQPRDFTISGKVGRVTKVTVHNEYHLPTSTITRVIAGPTIKTVFTQSLPISEKKTLLFWKIYRNFWIDPYVDVFSGIGDGLIAFLMDKTIDEDVAILKNVYPQHRIGPLRTRYDLTIDSFRKRVDQYLTLSDDPGRFASGQHQRVAQQPPADPGNRTNF